MKTRSGQQSAWSEAIIQDAWKAQSATTQSPSPPMDTVTTPQHLRAYANAYSVCRHICRMPIAKLKTDDLNELFHKYKVPEPYHKLLHSLAQSRTTIPMQVASVNATPTIIGVSYSINVVVSSKYLKSCLLPFIELTIQMSDGAALTFEMNLARFHATRQAISQCLRQMHMLATRNVIVSQ